MRAFFVKTCSITEAKKAACAEQRPKIARLFPRNAIRLVRPRMRPSNHDEKRYGAAAYHKSWFHANRFVISVPNKFALAPPSLKKAARLLEKATAKFGEWPGDKKRAKRMREEDGSEA